MEQDASPNADAGFAGEAAPTAFDQFLLLLESGGPVLYVLCALSLLAATIIIGKFIQFRALRMGRRDFIDTAIGYWETNRLDQALGVLETQPNPIARVLEVALLGTAAPGLSRQVVREEVQRVAALELDRIKSGLSLLSSIATLSPLIGLLGTVLGMIDAFQSLEAAGSSVDPSILSGGIWVALLTTAGGLLVAIPAAAAHNWFQSALYRYRRAMEDAVTRIFTLPIDEPVSVQQPAGAPAPTGYPAE